MNALGGLPLAELRAYYAVSIVVLTVLVHFSIAVTQRPSESSRCLVIGAAYFCGLALMCLTPTDLLVSNVRVFDMGLGLTASRVPGPMYWAFVLYAVTCVTVTLAITIRGCMSASTLRDRCRNVLLLCSLLPMLAVVPLVLMALHMDLPLFNAALVFPVAVTCFLLVTAYATHRYRLIEIEYLLPWSRVRKRKAKLYEGLHRLERGTRSGLSPQQAVDQLADALAAPVALVSGPDPILSRRNGSQHLASVSRRTLRAIDRLTVAAERTHSAVPIDEGLESHGIAVVVPYFTTSQSAACWLVIGRSPEDALHSARDFHHFRIVIARLGDIFLDRLMFLRQQMHALREQMQELQHRLELERERAATFERQAAQLARWIVERR